MGSFRAGIDMSVGASCWIVERLSPRSTVPEGVALGRAAARTARCREVTVRSRMAPTGRAAHDRSAWPRPWRTHHGRTKMSVERSPSLRRSAGTFAAVPRIGRPLSEMPDLRWTVGRCALVDDSRRWLVSTGSGPISTRSARLTRNLCRLLVDDVMSAAGDRLDRHRADSRISEPLGHRRKKRGKASVRCAPRGEHDWYIERTAAFPPNLSSGPNARYIPIAAAIRPGRE